MANHHSFSNASFDFYDNPVYPTFMYISGFLAFFVGGFGVFITWFWSPKIFGHYKYFLFNISLWAFAFDSYTAFLFHPFLLYPAVICCPSGFLRTSEIYWAKIWFDVMIFFYGGVSVAVLSAFIYRFAILKGKLPTILGFKFLTFLVFLHVTYEIPTYTFFHLANRNTTAVDESIVQYYPNIIKHYPNENMRCAAVSLDVDYPYGYLFLAVILLSFFATMPFIAVLVYKTKNLLEKQKTKMTERTYLMHKELLRTLIFQFLIPIVTLSIPYVIIASFLIARISNITVFQASFIVGTFHSTMNTVMMIYFIKPYRSQFIKVFCKIPKSVLIEKWKKYKESRVLNNNSVVYSINRDSQQNLSLLPSSTIQGLSVRPAESLLVQSDIIAK